VFDYIERSYNPKRRRSTLGYLSPMEFEMNAHWFKLVSTEPAAAQCYTFVPKNVAPPCQGFLWEIDRKSEPRHSRVPTGNQIRTY
jgi:hypothetical protein